MIKAKLFKIELDKEIESLSQSIAQDSNTIRLNEINNTIERLKQEKERRNEKSCQLQIKLSRLNIEFPINENILNIAYQYKEDLHR